MTQYQISITLCVGLLALVAGRAVTLRHRGIKAIVFGNTDKSNFMLISFMLAIVYTICSNAFGLSMYKPLVAPFWLTQLPGVVGIVICTITLVGLAVSLVSFCRSFRVGNDDQNPDKLVTTGRYYARCVIN
ncbi:MAG: hypothetical protein FWH40_09935 [Coriobacteriia bacterium]|nr:hypothetical protein [Coriobacteriia bacterium]